jgi:hypothetical protein
MPVFLQGRRAFLSSLRRRHRRCNPLSVHRVTNSGLAYPRRAYSCRACPAAATCHSYPSSSTPLPPVTPTLTSPPPLRLPPATPFLTLPTSLPPPSDTEAPHGPQPLPLGLKCRHGPRPFCSSARSTDTARAPSAVLRDVAQPIPVPALPGAQKRRTEPHRGPSAAKKQPICRGSITAAGHLALRKIAFSESRYPDTWEYQVITSSEEDSFSI